MRDEIRRIEWSSSILTPFKLDPDIRFSTDIWAGFWDGQFAIAWGLIPPSLMAEQAFVWSIADPAVLKHCRKTFLRRTREIVQEIRQTYPVLYGLCDGQSVWLKHLGASFGGGFNGLTGFEIR